MANQICPPLGTGSVDFDALHVAAKHGHDLTEALKAATVGGPPQIATVTEYEEKPRRNSKAPSVADPADAGEPA